MSFDPDRIATKSDFADTTSPAPKAGEHHGSNLVRNLSDLPDYAGLRNGDLMAPREVPYRAANGLLIVCISAAIALLFRSIF